MRELKADSDGTLCLAVLLVKKHIGELLANCN